MTARILILAAAFGLALTACDGLMKSDDQNAKRPASGGDAEFEANIMIGRVEVMQEQTHRGLQALGVIVPVDSDALAAETYQRLRLAVDRYNHLSASACGGRVVSGGFCGRTYQPAWVAGRPDSNGIKMAAQDMQNTMVPLWDAVCAKAKAKTGDEHFCAIE